MPLPDPDALIVFVAAAVALLITPGPAVVYIVARSLDLGTRAGFVSALGINLGSLPHIAAAAFGVAALLVASPGALLALQLTGGAFLVYLGIARLRSGDESEAGNGKGKPESLLRVFGQGFIVNLLNPKGIVFFFAFLPQFVAPERGSVAAQILVLGGIFLTLAVLSDSMFVLLAGSLRRWIRSHPGFPRAQRYFSGGILIALGVATAIYGGIRSG